MPGESLLSERGGGADTLWGEVRVLVGVGIPYPLYGWLLCKRQLYVWSYQSVLTLSTRLFLRLKHQNLRTLPPRLHLLRSNQHGIPLCFLRTPWRDLPSRTLLPGRVQHGCALPPSHIFFRLWHQVPRIMPPLPCRHLQRS